MILIPALPLLAAIVTALLGPRVLRTQSHWPAILGMAGACICSLLLLLAVRQQVAQPVEQVAPTVGYEQVQSLWTWARVPQAVDAGPEAGTDFQIDVSLRSDPLTVIMLVMVTFVATLVAIYGVGYMHGDRGYWRFFAYISLFVFSMTMSGVGQQLPVAVCVLGSRGRLQLPADWLLVRKAPGRGGWEEGFPRQSRGRLRFHARPVLDLDRVRHVEFSRYRSGHWRPGAAATGHR